MDALKQSITKTGEQNIGMGKGTLYLMIANGVLFLSGYAIHIGLGRYLSPTDYGTFGVVLYIMTTINLFLTSGFPQSASKCITENPSKLDSVIRQSNKIQIIFCVCIFALYLGLSDFIAKLFNDPSITIYIRISAFAIPPYALYSIYLSGYLNGLRRFNHQAINIIVVSVIRVITIFLLIFLGFGVGGAILGYPISAVIGFVLAWKLLGHVRKTRDYFSWKQLVSFGVLATLFSALFFLLFNIDLFMIKATVSVKAEVGFYTAATTIARISYFIFSGLALSLFPSISKSISLNDSKLTKNYIQKSMRYMLMLLIPGIFLLSATAADLITLVYSSRYIEAADSLRILALGFGFLTIFFVLANIIMGSGKPMVVLIMVLSLVAMDIGLNILLIPKYGLIGAAWSTTISGFLGMCATATFVLWRFRVLISPKSLFRISIVSALIYIIALQFSSSSFWLLVIYIGLFILYIGLLWLIREINSEDVIILKKMLPLRYSILIGRYHR